MLITTGIGKGKSRFRNSQPSSHASSVVKRPKTSEASIREIDSSCNLLLATLRRLWTITYISGRSLYRPRALWRPLFRHIYSVLLWNRPCSRDSVNKVCRLQRWGWGCSMQRDLVLLPIRRSRCPLVCCFRQRP
jgi:hypothetical protein